MKSAKKMVTRIVKAAAVRSLRQDANRTTCGAIYQPKVPDKLTHYKKEKR